MPYVTASFEHSHLSSQEGASVHLEFSGDKSIWKKGKSETPKPWTLLVKVVPYFDINLTANFADSFYGTAKFLDCRAASAVTEPLSLLPYGAADSPEDSVDAQKCVWLAKDAASDTSQLPAEVCTDNRC